MVLLKLVAGILLAVATFLLYKIAEHGRALKRGRLMKLQYNSKIVQLHRRMAYLDLGIIFGIVLLLEFALRVLGARPVYSAFFFFHLACAVTFLIGCLTAFYATGLRNISHHRPIVTVVIVAFVLMTTTGSLLLYRL